MALYTVELTLGDQSFTLDHGDDPDPDAALVLDGLVLDWRFAEEDWPGAPLDPMFATIGLAAHDVALLNGIEEGDLGFVRCLDSAGLCFAAVYGTVNEVVATQSRRGDRVWTAFAVSLVDHTSRQEQVTASFPAQGVDARFAAIRSAVGTPMRLPGVSPGGGGGQNLLALDVADAGLVDVLRSHYREALSDNSPRYMAFLDTGHFYLTAPVANADDGSLALMSAHYLRDVTWAMMPATLALVDHVLMLTPYASAGVQAVNAIEADRVELASGQWRKGREGMADAVTVKQGDALSVTVYAEGVDKETAKNRRVVESTLDSATWLENLAWAYLPDPVPSGWDRDGFVWRVEDPVELGGPGGWFPVLDDDVYSTAETNMPEVAASCFYRPVGVFGIADDADFGGGNYYAGLLKGVSLMISKGAVLASFSVRRHLPRLTPSGTDFITPTWLRANFPGVQLRVGVDVVDPGITVRDLRITRK